MTKRSPLTAGQILRQHREKRGLSRRQFSDLIDCSERTVIALEFNQTTPRLETALRIEEEVGIPMSAWVTQREAG